MSSKTQTEAKQGKPLAACNPKIQISPRIYSRGKTRRRAPQGCAGALHQVPARHRVEKRFAVMIRSVWIGCSCARILVFLPFCRHLVDHGYVEAAEKLQSESRISLQVCLGFVGLLMGSRAWFLFLR